ncbi:MAG: SLBB domain-containing protein [Sphaerochaetaceae bacterium]|nr:SLBB domain-containing protein [Sphaerochaetaceae bacterium]
MKNCRSILLFLIVLMLSVCSVFAEGVFVQSELLPITLEANYMEQLNLNAVTVPSNTVLSAIGNSSYPVTPGDTFSLSYSDGKSPVSVILQADTDCKVFIPSVGYVSAEGMTYKTFKSYVENLIATYYTYSSPQLVLTGCGLFSVRVTGEVSYAQYVTAWGLSRLSDVAVYADSYASTRQVYVNYQDGSSKVYDLYDALRNGNEDNNPLLVPGCEVVFVPANTTVGISGAVKRPGVYQVLKGQTAYDLVQDYAKGATVDSLSISVTNTRSNSEVSILDEKQAKAWVLKDGDMLTVATEKQALPYVTVTGAVASVVGNSTLTSANKVLYSFVPGETVEMLLRNIATLLMPTSDTDSIYILRDGNKIVVNMDDAFASNEKGSVELMQGDTVVIPFTQMTVTVTGAVNKPGTYAYVPDRSAEYYINLAGGFTSTATKGIKVQDKEGNKIGVDLVPADATIVASNNNLTANIAITASVLAIVSAVLNIIIDTHTVSKF